MGNGSPGLGRAAWGQASDMGNGSPGLGRAAWGQESDMGNGSPGLGQAPGDRPTTSLKRHVPKVQSVSQGGVPPDHPPLRHGERFPMSQGGRSETTRCATFYFFPTSPLISKCLRGGWSQTTPPATRGTVPHVSGGGGLGGPPPETQIAHFLGTAFHFAHTSPRLESTY